MRLVLPSVVDRKLCRLQPHNCSAPKRVLRLAIQIRTASSLRIGLEAAIGALCQHQAGEKPSASLSIGYSSGLSVSEDEIDERIE